MTSNGRTTVHQLSMVPAEGADGIDGVGFDRTLVVPVSQHPGESQRDAAGKRAEPSAPSKANSTGCSGCSGRSVW